MAISWEWWDTNLQGKGNQRLKWGFSNFAFYVVEGTKRKLFLHYFCVFYAFLDVVEIDKRNDSFAFCMLHFVFCILNFCILYFMFYVEGDERNPSSSRSSLGGTDHNQMCCLIVLHFWTLYFASLHFVFCILASCILLFCILHQQTTYRNRQILFRCAIY